MIYWDTSCVLKLYLKEPDSEGWFHVARTLKAPLLSSTLLETELACALRAKEHRSESKPGSTKELLDRFSSDKQVGRFRLFPLSPDIVEQSKRLVVEWETMGMLRSLDALHLATCLHLECTEIATTDQRLAEAAQRVGISLTERERPRS